MVCLMWSLQCKGAEEERKKCFKSNKETQIRLNLSKVASAGAERAGQPKWCLCWIKLVTKAVQIIIYLPGEPNQKEGTNLPRPNGSQLGDDIRPTGTRLAKRSTAAAAAGATNKSPGEQPDVDSTRVVAVSGQWIEFQCPLASELLAVSSTTPTSSSRPVHSIIWLKGKSSTWSAWSTWATLATSASLPFLARCVCLLGPH